MSGSKALTQDRCVAAKRSFNFLLSCNSKLYLTRLNTFLFNTRRLFQRTQALEEKLKHTQKVTTLEDQIRELKKQLKKYQVLN